jgi:hypothetical protein
MAIISSSINMSRYQTDGDVSAKFSQEILDNLRRYSFLESAPEDENGEKIGWVSLDNMFISPLDDDSFDRNGYITMSMRIDKKTVSSRTLKVFLIKEEQRQLEQSGSDKLSKTQKKDIKDAVRMKLLQQALPTIAIYDFFWNLKGQSLYFFSLSEGVNNRFYELFSKTFKMGLIKTSPFGLAVSNGYEEKQILALA